MLLLLAIFTCTQASQAQVTIGAGIEPVKGALLDLKSNKPDGDNVAADKGIVLPRVKLDDPENMTNMHPIIPLSDPEWLDVVKRDRIKKEHTGLMVYNLFESPAGTAENKRFGKGIYVWDGERWQEVAGSQDVAPSNAWLLDGNSSINETVNFIGTTDSKPLLFKTNSTERMRISAAGNVGIHNGAALASYPHSSAALDIDATDKGILIPRVELRSTNLSYPVSTPAVGLLVYNTKDSNTNTDYGVYRNNFYSWDGSKWVPMLSRTTINTMRLPEPAIFQLTSDLTNFLNNVHAGVGKGFFVATVVNSIPDKVILGMASSGIGSRITFKPGVYQITFVYEAETNAPDCTLSSYFVDFPNTGGGTKRIHSTAAHAKDQLSNHGGTVMYSFKTNTDVNWDVHLGRGQSGNCWDQNRLGYHDNMKLIAGSTHISIVRLGDYF